MPDLLAAGKLDPATIEIGTVQSPAKSGVFN
jgi:hypothetical protein